MQSVTATKQKNVQLGRKTTGNLSKYVTPWLFMIPALLPLCVFYLYPIFYSFYISFTDWDYISPEVDFVLFENYYYLFTDPIFYQVLVNTLYFMLGTVLPTVVGGLLLAMLISNKQKGMSIYRTIIFSPWVTPTVAISIVWSWIYEPDVGLANWLLSLINLPALGWTSSTTWAMPAVIIVTVWKGVGWAMIFYMHALKTVPSSLYEAADLDGAGRFKKFIHITIPLISPTTLFLVIITMIDAIQAYDQIQVMTQGGPAGSTRTILYMFYQAAFEQFDMGRATAVSTILVIITGLLAAVQFYVSRKWVHYQ